MKPSDIFTISTIIALGDQDKGEIHALIDGGMVYLMQS